MGENVLPCLSPVILWELTLQIDALPDGGIVLQLQFVPELVLSHQDERHGVHRVHLVVQKEADFFQSILGKKMSLIDDGHHGLAVYATDHFKLLVKLSLCIAPVELGLNPELVQKAFVEPSWCQLGIREIKNVVLFLL